MYASYNSRLSAYQHNILAPPVTSVGQKRPCTRLVTQRVAGGSVDDSIPINQTQQEVEGEWSAIPDLIDSHLDEE